MECTHLSQRVREPTLPCPAHTLCLPCLCFCVCPFLYYYNALHGSWARAREPHTHPGSTILHTHDPTNRMHHQLFTEVRMYLGVPWRRNSTARQKSTKIDQNRPAKWRECVKKAHAELVSCGQTRSMVPIDPTFIASCSTFAQVEQNNYGPENASGRGCPGLRFSAPSFFKAHNAFQPLQPL